MGDQHQEGTLFIVSTPIGNLEDITYRAVNVLAAVDLIAAEDTRKTKILLDHYHISKPMVSYFSYNEVRRVPELIAKLERGASVAVVSDAGTPGISDPAFKIIREAVEHGIPVVAIPGPSAFLAALISSGLPSARFVYEGFLPVKKGRKTLLQTLKEEERTIVLYESPHRLLRTLNDVLGMFGDRQISVCRELTKKFEEVVRGSISFVLHHFERAQVRGEFVLVIEGKESQKAHRRHMSDERQND